MYICARNVGLFQIKLQNVKEILFILILQVFVIFVSGKAAPMGSNGSGEAEPKAWLSGYCSRKLGELERASAEEVLLPPLAIAMIMGAGMSNCDIYILFEHVILNPSFISVDYLIKCNANCPKSQCSKWNFSDESKTILLVQ